MNKRQKQKQELKQKLINLEKNYDLLGKVFANENSEIQKKVSELTTEKKELKELVKMLEKRERTMSYLIMAWAAIEIVKWVIE